MTNEQAYFARRADEERAAAERAGDPAARAVHLELAERYALRSISLRSAFPERRANGADVIPIRPLGS